MLNNRSPRRGITLTEILIGAVILALCAVPVIAVFMTSKGSIVRTDVRRRYNFYTREILARVDRASLHTLWNYYGPKGFAVNLPGFFVGNSGKFHQELAAYDPNAKKLLTGPPASVNPLGFTEELLNEMAADGMVGKLQFEFFSKKALRIKPPKPPNKIGEPDDKFGLLHMQAGWAKVTLADLKTGEVLHEDCQTIMCPAIVGRPGLKLSSCPALNPAVYDVYSPLLDQHETSLGDPPPW